MKTTNEIMSEIKVLTNKINELCIDIDELKHIGKNQNQLDNSKLKAIAKRYPVLGHPLSKSDIYTKNLYLTLLASILSIDNIDSSVVENGRLFILRIIEGLEEDIEFENIYKNSLELDEKIIDEFTLAISMENLQNNFVVDSVIVANLSGKCGDKVLEYMSTLFEMIKIQKNELGELVRLAVLILEKNKKSYKEFCCEELNIDLQKFFFYIFDFCDGILSNNSKLFYLEYKSQKEIMKEDDITDMININSKIVIIGKTLFKNIEKFPIFQDCNDIKIINSEFEESKCPIEFKKCKKISISNSLFKKFKSRALYFNECNEVELFDSIIDSSEHRVDSKPEYYYNYPAYGGAVYVTVAKSFIIDSCKFNNCNTYQSESGPANGAIAYIHGVECFKLSNSTFKNCMNYSWRYGSHWDKAGELFQLESTECKKAVNCIRIDSAKAGYIIGDF